MTSEAVPTAALQQRNPQVLFPSKSMPFQVLPPRSSNLRVVQSISKQTTKPPPFHVQPCKSGWILVFDVDVASEMGRNKAVFKADRPFR